MTALSDRDRLHSRQQARQVPAAPCIAEAAASLTGVRGAGGRAGLRSPMTDSPERVFLSSPAVHLSVGGVSGHVVCPFLVGCLFSYF